MVHTIAILVLAWPIADVTKDLGLSQLITITLGDNLPGLFAPVFFYRYLTSCVFYCILLRTIRFFNAVAIPLAAITGGSIPMTIGAVIAGGTFGDVTSPL